MGDGKPRGIPDALTENEIEERAERRRWESELTPGFSVGRGVSHFDTGPAGRTLTDGRLLDRLAQPICGAGVSPEITTVSRRCRRARRLSGWCRRWIGFDGQGLERGGWWRYSATWPALAQSCPATLPRPEAISAAKKRVSRRRKVRCFQGLRPCGGRPEAGAFGRIVSANRLGTLLAPFRISMNWRGVRGSSRVVG